jgi:predicted nucleic acid-binding protein
MVSFDTDVLVHAVNALPNEKAVRARNVVERTMRASSGILLLQPLSEFCDFARKARVQLADIENIMEAWSAVLPIAAPDEDDFRAAVKALSAFPSFRDALLWASAKGAGVKHLLTETLADGLDFQGVVFVNPFMSKNAGLIDNVLRRSRRRR